MSLVISDRVKETTITSGTGSITLTGAVGGFRPFSSAIGNSNTTYYAITNSNGEFEVGLGTVTDAGTDTLSRDTILSSSNSDSAVNFSAGTKDVFCTLPASKAVLQNDSGVASATTFSGSGAQLTNLNASNVASGTLPDARFPATLPAANGSALTNLNASNVASGTLSSDRLPTVPTTKGGTGLTAIGSANQVLAVNSGGTALEFQTPTTGDITGVTAGSGLTGGGTTGDVTLNVGAGTGIDVAADSIAVDVSDFMTNGSNNRVLTATGTDAMNAEANMTFDGSTLAVTGAITATGDVTAFSTSDKNLKQNIINIDNSLDKVSKLNGVYYNWTKEALEKNKHLEDVKEVGVIAQDVEEVLPEIVATRENGTKAVKYERLCALLIESVKELKKEIEELKSGA